MHALWSCCRRQFAELGFLVRLLAGLPPLPVGAEHAGPQIAVEGAAVRVESKQGTWWQRLWTGQDGLGIERGEAGRDSETILRFGFSDRRQTGDVEFPFALWVEDASGRGRFQLEYERVQLNRPVEDSLFDLPPPQDERTKIYNLGGALPLWPGPTSGRSAPAHGS